MSGNRTVGVVLHVWRAVVATLPVVRGGSRGLPHVHQVPVAVCMRLPIPQKVEYDVGLVGVRDEVEV